MTTTDAAIDEELRSLDSALDAFLEKNPPAGADPHAFLGAQYDAGLAWVHFPVGLGGLGLSPRYHPHTAGRIARAGGPTIALMNVIGYGMVAPTLVAHGTEEQKERYLRRLFTCEDIWCQLFSEPGAGSDVASLSARAVKDGDEWIVDGQKVWTTLAHLSNFGLLLARTDPDAPKHRGITAFLVDMHGPGVEVRPLHQITGEAEFNEIFFTEARIPDATRLGGVGEGWGVAITTLMNERVSIGGGIGRRNQGPIGDVMKVWREHWAGVDSPQAKVFRDRVAAAWIRSEVARLTNLRSTQARRTGTPGPDGSVSKLSFAEENKRVYELCIDMLGAEGMLYSSEYPKIRPEQVAIGTADIHKAFLRVRANSIEGGTSEVMRNILGERVLGLPGEPRTDKTGAWKDIPRS